MRLPIPAALISLALLAASASAHFAMGQMYVIDYQNSRVYYVDPANWTFNAVNPASQVANSPGAIGFNSSGHMLLANYGDDTVIELDGLGGYATVLSAADGLNGPWGPSGVVIGPGYGDIFITNIDSAEILKVSSNYSSSTVFADASNGLQTPVAVAVLADGHMLIADRGAANNILHLDKNTGVTTVFDVLPEKPVDMIVRVNRDIYVLTDQGNIFRYPGGIAGSRVLLGNYGGPSTNGGLDFSFDQDLIYHVCTADASIREIDPDTGASVVRLVMPGQPISLVMVGSQFPPGSYFNFGKGLVGTGAMEPYLYGQGEPRLGYVSQINAFDFVGGATVWLLLSASQVQLPFKGGTLYVSLAPTTLLLPLPAGGLPGVPGDGDVSLPVYMPNDPMLYGTKTYMQGLAVDPGAPQGVSMTSALTMFIGY